MTMPMDKYAQRAEQPIPPPEEPPAPVEPAAEPSVTDQQLRMMQQQNQQREQQFLQQLSQERNTREQYENYIWQQQISGLPQDQRQYAEAARQYQQYLNQVNAQYTQMQQYNQQLESAVLPIIKDRVYTHLSQQHKVEKELLAKYAETPAEADKIIKALADYRKRQTFEQRKDAGVDNAPSTSGQTNVTSNADDAMKKFRNSGDLRGYIVAKKQAGLW